MKALFALTIIFNILHCIASEPNFRLRFQDQFSAFRDCHALSSGVMIAAGERGRMIRSTDFGEHWRTVEINTFAHFTRIDFADNLRGVIADDSGKVWLTTDAGATWQITFTADQPLASIAFTSGNSFMVAGRRGGAWRGSIAANDWIKVDVGLDSAELADIAFSGLRGIILGKWGGISVTSDGGSSWKKFLLPNDQLYYKCGYISPNQSLIAGYHTITRAARFYRYDFVSGVWDTINPGHFHQVLDFAAVTKNDILGVGSFGYNRHSYDGGVTWIITDTLSFDQTAKGTKIKDNLTCIYILSNGSGLAAGGLISGSVATTSDYGKTWVVRSESPGFTIESPVFLAKDGYAASADSIIVVGGYQKRMYRTTDGGATWQRPYPLESYGSSWFNNVRFVSKDKGFAVGNNGATPYCFATTTDGGETWSDIQQQGKYLELPDAGHGCMVNFRESLTDRSRILFLSSDSGITWRGKYFKDIGLTDSSGVWGIGIPHFGSAGKGATILFVASKYPTFFYSEDWGETWSKGLVFDTTSGIQHIHYKSPNTVFAFGENGALMRSDDDGRQWRILNSQLSSLAGLLFLTDSLALAAGLDATVAVSTDGGETWQKADVPLKKTSYEEAQKLIGDNYSFEGMCRVNDSTAYLLGFGRIVRVVVTIDRVVGVQEIFLASSVQISPNPAAESFTVHCPEFAVVTVRDVFGRVKAINETAASEVAAFSTAEYPSGVYFVEVVGKDNSRAVQKVAVSR